MTLILELAPEREAILREMAAAQGVDANAYALRLLDDVITTKTIEKRPFHEASTPEEWLAALHEWTNSHAPQGPVLVDDRREVLYED